VCLINKLAHLCSALQQVKLKAQQLVKPSCLSSGHSFAPNTHSSMDAEVVGVPEKAVLQKSPRSVLRMKITNLR